MVLRNKPVMRIAGSFRFFSGLGSSTDLIPASILQKKPMKLVVLLQRECGCLP